MNDHESRAVVRAAIVRQFSAPASGAQPQALATLARPHYSHGLFVLPTGADAGGPCVIEPSVACNHCGYCKSYGH